MSVARRAGSPRRRPTESRNDARPDPAAKSAKTQGWWPRRSSAVTHPVNDVTDSVTSQGAAIGHRARSRRGGRVCRCRCKRRAEGAAPCNACATRPSSPSPQPHRHPGGCRERAAARAPRRAAAVATRAAGIRFVLRPSKPNARCCAPLSSGPERAISCPAAISLIRSRRGRLARARVAGAPPPPLAPRLSRASKPVARARALPLARPSPCPPLVP